MYIDNILTLLASFLEILSCIARLSTSGSHQTDLSARTGILADNGRMTDMLVITSTMGMLQRVHCHTTGLGPAVTFYFAFVISFQQGLVDTTASGDDFNDCCLALRPSYVTSGAGLLRGSTPARRGRMRSVRQARQCQARRLHEL